MRELVRVMMCDVNPTRLMKPGGRSIRRWKGTSGDYLPSECLRPPDDDVNVNYIFQQGFGAVEIR